MKKLGQKGASTVTLALQDCRIPASARMGEEGEGYPLLLRSVVRSRISAAAQGLGFAQGAYDAVVTWASDHELLSSRASAAQDLQFDLARLRGEITAARAMLLSVCDQVDSSAEEPVAEVSLVKMHCTALGTRVAAACLELLGADGDLVSLGCGASPAGRQDRRDLRRHQPDPEHARGPGHQPGRRGRSSGALKSHKNNQEDDVPKLTYDALFIGGEFVAPDSADTLTLVSPVTEEEIGHVPSASKTDVDRAVASARECVRPRGLAPQFAR